MNERGRVLLTFCDYSVVMIVCAEMAPLSHQWWLGGRGGVSDDAV